MLTESCIYYNAYLTVYQTHLKFVIGQQKALTQNHPWLSNVIIIQKTNSKLAKLVI